MMGKTVSFGVAASPGYTKSALDLKSLLMTQTTNVEDV